MTRVLVTGGCGFIGRHLVNALAARGEKVRVMDQASSGEIVGKAEQVTGSILDRVALTRALEGVDCVYHLAGIAHLWTPARADFDRINHQGTISVLEASAAARVSRVVHCSTESILFSPGRAGRIDETASPAFADMAGPYTRSKFKAEEAARAAARSGLPVVIVNPTVPIGPGDFNLTPPAAMLSLFLKGGSPLFLDCVLNLVDVRDVAEGMRLAAERGTVGERYVLGGQNLRFAELLARLEQLSGRPMPKRRIPGWAALAFADLAEWAADHVTGRSPATTREGVSLALRSAPLHSGKAGRDLGYAPRSIDKALAETVAWIAAKRDGAAQA